MEKRKTSVPWTEREDALLCRMRNDNMDCGYDEMAGKLPHRTPIAVKRRVAHLISVGRMASRRAAWTVEEDALICELRAKGKSGAEIAPLLEERTPAAVARRIQQLRLEGRVGDLRAPPVSGRRWSDREEWLVVRMRESHARVEDIAAKLPERTPRAVSARVGVLLEADELERAAYSPRSHRPWSPEEDALVALMRSADMTMQEMAAALDRTVPSVSSRISQRVRKGELRVVRASSERG